MEGLKKTEDYPLKKRPVFYENTAIENALGDFTSSCQYTCGRTREGCLRVIGAEIGNFNAYGRIVHKKEKGCSTFYKLLDYESKKDGWDNASRGMERDLTDFDPNYVFEIDEFYSNVKKIMNLNFFNRIKQFMIRLYRNNLFLGDKTKNGQKNGITTCFACDNHPENRVETLLNCSRSNKILQFLIRVMKKAGILNNG